MTIVSLLGQDLDLEIQQGADCLFPLVIADNTQTPPVPINIAGYQFRAQLRKAKASTTVLATFTAEITDGPHGEVTLSLDANTTAALIVGVDDADPMSSYVWDVQMTDGNGKVSYPFAGSVTVTGSVTRAA